MSYAGRFQRVRARPARFHSGRDASSWAEDAGDDRPYRIAGPRNIVQNLVHHILLEDTQIAVTEEVLFVGLQLEAPLSRHVA